LACLAFVADMKSARALASSHGHLADLCSLNSNVQRLWMHGAVQMRPRSHTLPMVQTPRQSVRKFGIEIEQIVPKTVRFQSFSDILHSLSLGEDADSWNLVEDKSIETEGQHIEHIKESSMRCELVSPVLQYDRSTMNTLESICDDLQHRVRAITNESCGFHVHFDAEDLSVRDVIALSVNYANFERVIDSFVDRSRRGDSNPYIRSMVQSIRANLDDLREILETEDHPFATKASLSVLDMINPNGKVPRKCHKLNISNLFYHNLSRSSLNKTEGAEHINTVENRHHQSTLDFDEIQHWIHFQNCFINSSQNKPVVLEQQDSFSALADFLEDDACTSFYERRQQCSV